MYARDDFESMVLSLAKNISIQAVAKMYVGLLVVDPGESGAYSEISYTGYTRREITFTEPTPGTGSHSIQNTAIITFPECHESAGTVTHIGIFGSPNPNTGTMYLYGDLDEDIVVNSGVSPVFQAGSIKYTLSGKIGSTWRTRILNFFRGNPITGFVPYFGCANADIETAGGTEFTSGSYARVQIPFSTPAPLDSGGAMEIHNSSAIVTPYATAQWGEWYNTIVFDASSGGNIFYSSPRSQRNTIYKGGACGYEEGNLVLTLN